VLYQKNSFPYIHYKPDFSSVKRIFSAPVDADLYDDHLISQSSSTHTRERQQSETSERKPVKRPDESTQLTKQRYAVQAAAGYDSRHLYELRDALIQAGYPAYLVSIQTPDGIMFKLRVGAFNKREPAEALRDKLRNRYPETLSNSFVIEGA
jgi:cell division septation protein DedD